MTQHITLSRNSGIAWHIRGIFDYFFCLFIEFMKTHTRRNNFKIPVARHSTLTYTRTFIISAISSIDFQLKPHPVKFTEINVVDFLIAGHKTGGEKYHILTKSQILVRLWLFHRKLVYLPLKNLSPSLDCSNDRYFKLSATLMP